MNRIDTAALARWMDGAGLAADSPLEGLRPISGGTQNVMVRFERGGREFVLRRGPWYLRPPSNDALRREIRVMAALSTTEVPHPRLIAACEDETVLGGAVGYLMEPVDGFNPGVELPPLHSADPAVRHRMGLAMVDALAALGTFDHVAVGLAGLGRPRGFLERQVPRWLRELDSYAEHRGWPGPGIPGIPAVADWLERNRPTRWAPGLLHGDYHMANVMFSRTGPQVAAVVDWEMCTVGDPLLDLGWLLATWPDEEGRSPLGGTLAGAGGLATGAELTARCAERTTRDLKAVAWYEVLACFKLGILLEGTHARACAGKAPVETGDRLHTAALRLFERARLRITAA
ncbi:phosphotransferase family protein [Peterkaempfera sp. SMS 1(5)a]|uniref:phosphotransferase family protein n=1 Tax=Peterkaempfera podocarpi TaxID=3232308 RepID=UPI00366C2701